MGFASINGGVADVIDVAVVGIAADSGGGECTGALIAPDLVLTAQHCVAAPMNLGDCAQATFGAPRPATDFYVTTRPTLTLNPGDYHRVAAIALPPGTGFCGRDIALLRLADRTITGEAVPIAPRLAPAVSPGEVYAAVGYGGTDDLGTDAGTRRRRDGLSVVCVGAGCALSFVGDQEWRGRAGVCAGDSGGPALDVGGQVVGVASRGSVGCVDPVYESVAAHRDWLIASAVAAAASGGYPPPTWTGAASAVDAGVDGPAMAPDAASDPAFDDGGCCDSGRRGAPSDGVPVVVVAAVVLRRARRDDQRSGRARPRAPPRSR